MSSGDLLAVVCILIVVLVAAYGVVICLMTR